MREGELHGAAESGAAKISLENVDLKINQARDQLLPPENIRRPFLATPLLADGRPVY